MKKDKELKKIPSHMVSRSLSLLNLTLSSGTRYAGLKLTDLFSSGETREKNLQEFLKGQTSYLVEELGRLKGSIMKAGQMLSVYGEHFFSPQINQILKSLQANTRPVVWSEMEKVIRTQLGEQKFAQLSIDSEPVAAASMGQVYRATIKSSGTLLALKVQYPGVDKAIDSDLNSLKTILSVSHLIPNGSNFDEIFREVRMMLHYEVDYLRELENFELFRNKLADDPRFIIPLVYPEFSTKRLLAMSYEEGLGFDYKKVEDLDQIRRNKIGAALTDLMFKEIFEWRMVQTDPHFGNYKVKLADKFCAEDRIVLLDFGAVRIFPKRYIDAFSELVISALNHDASANFRAGVKLGFLKEEDPAKVRDLFAKICFMAIEGFEEQYASPKNDGSEEGSNPYCWGTCRLVERLAELTKDAIFAFKFRPPPREAIFLDRKMIGVYTTLTRLDFRMGPRGLLLKYIEASLAKKATSGS